MLTVHNFITRPLQLMKQGKEPRIRLTHTSDQYVARQAEKVSVSQTTGVGVREAERLSALQTRSTPLFQRSGSRCGLTIVQMAHKSATLVGNPGIFKRWSKQPGCLVSPSVSEYLTWFSKRHTGINPPVHWCRKPQVNNYEKTDTSSLITTLTHHSLPSVAWGKTPIDILTCKIQQYQRDKGRCVVKPLVKRRLIWGRERKPCSFQKIA